MARPLIYDRGFSGDTNLIARHDAIIKSMICNQLTANDAFINTTWIELDNNLIDIVNQTTGKVICYSGPDWENTKCRLAVHNFLKNYNPTYIGNTFGKHYFSFWVDFVYAHKERYNLFNPWNLSNNIKPYMCLNRKPHSHRIELVAKLWNKNIIKDNFVSLGSSESDSTDNYKNLPATIRLKTDVVNVEGDLSVSGRAGGITNDITSLGHSENWNSYFLNVVTETTVHTDVFLSEKIFKPILGMRPFIVLGDDRIYEVLKRWGFDLFEDLFGTGYTGKYYTDRINWIINVIENLEKETNLKNLLLSLKPRLEYNKNLFDEIAISNRLKIYNLELA